MRKHCVTFSFSRPAEDLTVVAVDCVELLGDPDEGGPAAQLLQFSRPDVGAGGADAAQHVPYRDLHRPFVGDLHRLALRRSGVSNKARRLVLTGRKNTHPQEAEADLYSATPPACFLMAVSELIP